jgi:PTH1 family peptidyl-tRNA hydrolase
MFDRLLNFFLKAETSNDSMKYLIAGLGNIGAEYAHTRHNIGFDVLDFLAREEGIEFKNDTLGDLTEMKYKGRTLILLKPSTYMNRSGKAVMYWMNKLKIQPENLLVVVDDLHLDLGKMRLRDRGSDGGHNGLKDIQETFGHSNFVRLRMGIGNDFRPGQQVNYVLGKWKKDEEQAVEQMIVKAGTAVRNFVTIGLKLTMDNLNR